MPLFKRLDKLPRKNEAIETEILELKKGGSETHFKLARGVAAFANHLGGVILIGASEKNGRIGEYEGITEERAAALEKAFSEAIEQRCLPTPLHYPIRFPGEVPGKVVLAVHVEPYMGGQPIGVTVKGKTRKADSEHEDPDYEGDCYVFPIRVGNIPKFLKPDQLAMFTEPRLRRIFIMLNEIPIGGQIKVQSITTPGKPAEQFLGKLTEVSFEKNVVRFDGASLENTLPRMAYATLEVRVIALDQIRSIYKPTADGATEHQWTIMTEPFV